MFVDPLKHFCGILGFHRAQFKNHWISLSLRSLLNLIFSLNLSLGQMAKTVDKNIHKPDTFLFHEEIGFFFCFLADWYLILKIYHYN